MRLSTIKYLLFSVSCLMIAATTVANGATIVSGTVYNNTEGEFGALFPVDNLSNQSGLSNGYINGVTDFATYIASAPTHTRTDVNTWLSGGIPSFPAILDFDLGGPGSIENLALWNGATGDGAHVQNFSVFTSNVADFSVSTLVGSFLNPQGVGLDPYPVTVFDLANTSAQFVRLRFDSYYGLACCISVGEVAFDFEAGVTPIPLPAGLPLFAGGLGLLGLLGWRKRRKLATANT